MPREVLPPDPDAEAQWRKLEQNAPSKKATPPIMGGNRLLWGILVIGFILAVVSIVARLFGGA
ncbi:MAG: hypothetical protein IT320_24580 [Anaerolineae bacterium]|nr:hypothetical protein [Anaerolineae bacterium]